ncbi:AraC family transcriptional regulator [Paenibacillus sp. JX-17]|uniref:AraC family transcriptional regulator n=1 Tax=Paenibacillus lacisoli TaxID=3064525 RepID=A0ABT9CFH6_9BACL|nr:helix-turn-helix domain-containing protein [Paenibacillus sp. JX-17]MDO7908029.1 AraC family transcriptional regulator [Paenibacillus sp. JX-17]
MRNNVQEDHHEELELYLFTPGELEAASPAHPLRIGHNRAKPNYHIGPRTTIYYYLMFVIEGRGRFEQNGGTYDLRANDIFCLFPGMTHEYATDPEHRLQKLFIAFDGPMAAQLLQRIGLTAEQPHQSGVLNDQLVRRMWNILNAASSPEPGSAELGRLAGFLQLFHELERITTTAPGIDQPFIQDWLEQGMHFMKVHYTEGITVAQAAEHAGVERTHFTRRFHQTYGITPIQYLQQLKIDKAKELLRDTSYTLTEIAQTVGYPDMFTFSKAFKKLTETTPKQYRLRQQTAPSQE